MDLVLYKGDCIEIMKNKMEANSVDLVLCDLPYGITNNENDKRIPFNDLWEAYDKVVKEDGRELLFGIGSFFIELVASNLKNFRYELVWDKILVSGFLNAKKMPLRQHELIGVFYKKFKVYNPQRYIGVPSHTKGDFKNKKHKNNNYGKHNLLEDKPLEERILKYPKSILKFEKKHPSVSFHPTEKSVNLLSYLILTYSNEEDYVLDNTMGAGSTAIACIETNRNFIGIELNEEYFMKAYERITSYLIEKDYNFIIKSNSSQSKNKFEIKIQKK